MANHFIVYSVRNGVESFFKGITDPSFFVGINKILNDKLYLHYIDPLHDETHTFSGLLEFVCAKEGLDIADWLPFMKALQAQDDGSAAKKLYKRMLDLDNRLDPLVGSSSRVMRMPGHGEIGNGRKDESRVAIRHSKGANQVSSESWDRILPRLARDAPEVLERVKSGEFKSARAAAIEAGIITPFPSLQLKDPAPTAQKLLAKKGKAWCLQLLEELSGLLEEPVSE
jgi:hypothetical protein